MPKLSSTTVGAFISMAGACLCTASMAATPTAALVYGFSTTLGGIYPGATLLPDSAGNLYGVAYAGGAGTAGVAFKLTAPAAGKTAWTETVLHGFGVGTDGQQPYGGLTADAAGNLYGGTASGGKNGLGCIFKLSPPKSSRGAWSETVIYSFPSPNGYVLAPLLIDKAGALYGTGSNGNGTVFKLTPPAAGKKDWVQTTLHSFYLKPTDGYSPVGGLVSDGSGALYGTTAGGGADGVGIVYKLTPPAWTETILYTFKGTTDGAYPTGGLVFDTAGDLYGTAPGGGSFGAGTIFKLSPPATGVTWKLNVIHTFTGAADGGQPTASLLFDTAGNLYGTAAGGGTASYECSADLLPTLDYTPVTVTGCGIVFKLVPPSSGKAAWTLTPLAGFKPPAKTQAFENGPGSTLVFSKGTLYGSTSSGFLIEGGIFGVSP